MAMKAADYLIFDEESGTYIENPEQLVRDDVEKHYWKNVAKAIVKDWRLYLMLLPMLAVFLLWRYLPMYELLGCFKQTEDAKTVAEQYYSGFSYFRTLLFGTGNAELSMQFMRAFRNTFLLSFYGLVLGFPVPILIALFFNEIRSNFARSIYLVLTYLPKFMSTVVMTSLVVMLVKQGSDTSGMQPGVISQMLAHFGFISNEAAYGGMLNNPAFFRAIYQISGIWESAGYDSIVFFAAIIAISPTSYEAAQIDGAGKLAQMRCLSGALEYSYTPQEIPAFPPVSAPAVQVYVRKNGEIGIRNELWVIPTVGCVNAQAKAIAEAFSRAHPAAEGIEGCFAFTHPYGCSQIGEDHERTKLILQRMVKHPNCGGVLVLGLGCENNRMDVFRETLGDYDESRTAFLVAQEVGDEIAEGVKLLEQLYQTAKNDRRVQRDLSCLRIGLKCGGSDGLSGITANPLVGRFSDFMAAAGGTTVLTEVPEMFGAEQLLMDRAADKTVFGKIVALINGFKEYYQKHGQPVYENPSPGNKAGGITTLEDKSLGCTQKSGSGKVCDVLFDGDCLHTQGLNLLSGPGNDMVAVTNLASAGCHMVLFTTGRGTPFGGFVPTVKISTNTELSQRKPNWIDFDAGSIVSGDSFENRLAALIALVAETASGRQTVNERSNSREIAIFKTGVTL